MREIKFSYMYQHYVSGKWIDLRYTLDEIVSGIPARRQLELVPRFKLIAKRQYTGLKDANGVEIYEGDVVRCSNEYRTVKIWMGNACLCLDDPTGFPIYPYNVNGHVEVISNIYGSTVNSTIKQGE